MKAVFFPNWSNALVSSGLPPQIINSHQIAIRWFLSYLKQNCQPATAQAAREFIDFAVQKKAPAPWMVDRWKAGIRWFFANAPMRKSIGKEQDGGAAREEDEVAQGRGAGMAQPTATATDGRRAEAARTPAGKMAEQNPEGELPGEPAAAGARSREGWAGTGGCDPAIPLAGAPASSEEALKWIEASRRLMRIRHMALATERSYLQWIADFFRFHGEAVVENFAEEDIASFLTYLAIERDVAYETQRQAA